jgi:urease beta subunit
MIPGEYFLAPGPVVANMGRRTQELEVANTGDRPIQVGSHFHFFEVNRALRFERARAFGMRLNIPSGTAVRFEPGDSKNVTLVELAGASKVFGLNGLTNGSADQFIEQSTTRKRACEAAKLQGFEGS